MNPTSVILSHFQLYAIREEQSEECVAKNDYFVISYVWVSAP